MVNDVTVVNISSCAQISIALYMVGKSGWIGHQSYISESIGINKLASPVWTVSERSIFKSRHTTAVRLRCVRIPSVSRRNFETSEIINVRCPCLFIVFHALSLLCTLRFASFIKDPSCSDTSQNPLRRSSSWATFTRTTGRSYPIDLPHTRHHFWTPT